MMRFLCERAVLIILLTLSSCRRFAADGFSMMTSTSTLQQHHHYQGARSRSSCHSILSMISKSSSDDFSSIELIRHHYASEADRETLLEHLLHPPSDDAKKRIPEDFDEVKTVLRMYLDHHQGTSFVFRYYEEVLRHLKDGAYENDSLDEEQWSKLLVGDLQKRFSFLGPSVEDQVTMNTLFYEDDGDWDLSRRKACGLALKALDFVELGFYDDDKTEVHP
jgi:hypothetical protein